MVCKRKVLYWRGYRCPVAKELIPVDQSRRIETVGEIGLLGAQVSNVVLDTSSSNSWVKTQVPGITLEEVFARALDVYGPKRILFGTDSSVFPRGWRSDIFEEQVGILEKLGVTADEAAGVLGENLARFTGSFPNGPRKQLIHRSTSATF